MCFVPTGPLNIISTSVLIALVLACWRYGDRGHKFAGLAMLVSLAAARYASCSLNPVDFVAGLCVAAFVSGLGHTTTSKVIAWIYGARVALVAIPVAGFSWVLFWEVTAWIAWLQMIVLGVSLSDHAAYEGRISKKMQLTLRSLGN